MKALVTGGGGFIGHHLARALRERGDEVRVIDNFATGKRERLSGLDIELIEGDLRSYERVAAAVRGVEVVFHLGALPSVPRSVQDPLTTNAVNVDGTLNILTASRDADVRRVVFTSSSSVYGDNPVVPKAETDIPLPLSPYAVSKLAGEQYARAFHASYGLETVGMRLFNVFGPGQDPLSQYAAVVPRFITRMLEGLQPQIYGDGLQTRDFTYVADVVDAFMLAGAVEGAAGHFFNISHGRQTSILALAEILSEIISFELEPERFPARTGEVRLSEGDGSKAREVLGWDPSWSVEAGLRECVEATTGVTGTAGT